MTSSMFSGDRRWASSKRGGMTVLGKVAVPKPINLPSQRLENHGLDPNVEIVPKGTLSWGSKSSSSASNAWGSSSLSSNANGGTSSPSHLSTRPSSGGSGARPSTSGSDRAPELTTNAWGSNSRPSSASGALASNQTSLTSLRPRSAETRHGGSQLSRFAEHVTENSVAWSDARTTEKLGVARCKNDDFSLSSGDFPTLGSEKDKSVQIIELQDHSSHTRPGSSSGLRRENNETSTADDVHGNANVSETTNSWRRDYQAYNEDDVRPGTEKWQGNLQSYPNAGIPPQHFDAWHGVPINNHQGDAWFRGPPNGPPYANSVAPGGFPIEPFPYYRPHLPPAGLPNQPQVPLPGTGPRGHHKNGDVYRPHMPDAYIHPGMSLRPGFYPGPMACEGYYSPPPPPMGYRNSNEQDVPFMGMAARPSVYNRYSNQNPPKPGNSQGRSGGYGPAGNPLASELVESCHTSDTAGSYRVLVKQHNGQDGKNEQTNWEDSVTSNTSYVNGRDQPGMSFGENDHKRNEEMDLKRTSAHGEQASQTLGNRGPSSFIINAQSPESTRSFNKIDDISVRELDGVASNVLEIPSRPSAPKDSSLIQKIKGLNAKARDNSSAQSKEEQRGKFHAGNHDENEVSAGVVFPETTCATEVINPTTYGVGASGGENNFESLSFSGTVPSRRIVHGMQGRGNHRKGRLNNQDADSGQKKSGIIDSSTSSDAQLEISNILVDDHEISVDAYERSESYSQARHDAESMQNLSDSVDSHAQHAKRKELAKKQTKKLQEEEEEWTRKQKAKALAKLDELNRCSQSVEGSMQKEYAANFALQNKLEECQPSATVLGKSGAVNSPVMFNANVVCQISDTNINKVEKLPVLSSEPPLETLKNAGKERHNQSVTLHQDFNCADATNALQVHNNTVSKQKKMGYKQKQNLSSEKTLKEMVVSTTSTAPKIEDDTMACVMVSSGIVTNEVSSASGSILPLKSNSMVESSVNQKKKHNRNSKNKHKVEETSSLAALPSIISKEAIFSKSSVESDKPNKHIELDQGLVQSAPLSKDSNQYSVQKSFVREESYDSMNSQSKSQHSRRMPRNAQANRQSEKSHGSDAVMWAPVKTQNKTQIVDESTENSQIEGIIPVKSDQQVHNLKNKRAEMERYIPKPVAKEMVQQGSLQAASSISQDPTNESVERVDSSSQGPQITRHTNSAIGKLGSRMLSKNGDSWQTKQGKTHGTWRQRNPTESTDVHGMQNGVNHGSNTDQNIQIPLVRQQARMSETRFLNDQTEHFNDSGEPNGSNNPDNHDSAALISTPIIKDRTAIVGERRVPFGGQKSTVMNHDVQKKNGGDTQKTETPFSSSEHGEPDGAVHKENRITGEHMSSHWQPKYQASNNRRGNRPNYQHVGSQVIQPNQKESTSQVVSFPDDGCDKESNALVAQPPPDQSGSGKSKGGETPNLGNNAEAKRERRNDPPKGRPHSPNQVAVRSSEQPASMDPSHEQRSSSGFRKNGNQNRFGKGHEFQGDWKSPAQDNRHHNQPTNRDKQGSNLRYGYHPVGPYDDSKADNSERPKDGSYHNRGRFRERGQTHRIRGGGNFLDAS